MGNADNRGNDELPEAEGLPTGAYDGVTVGPGGSIGPYKLLRILGEGGCGIVYLAEQQRPVKRRVALKVIKPGMDTKQVIARFEAERQALALLDHPNIAHVFSAGTTKTGRPYFAMEYVQGVPITEHSDRYNLTIEERLKLFLAVCEAVQHAHQKAIIHRDIKPSNILVAYEAEQAVPMIIDFGVAKALTQSLTARTLVTEQAQIIGTPEYMSPEQAEMTGQDIDTRTDIYSLGVVLYELLTGTLPFDPHTLRKGGPEQMRRLIREEEPQTPSARLSSIEREESAGLAQQRRTDVRTWSHRLHGELDWITLKAMHKDRTRRYQTAYALAEDIQRYLKQEPVLAGPPSAAYKFRKLIARNKSLFVSAGAVAVVVLLAATVGVVLAITATRARRLAEAARESETQQRREAEQAQNATEVLARQQEEDLYFNHIKLAYQELNRNRPVHALDLLEKCPERWRNWEWRYLERRSRFQETRSLEFDGDVLSFAFSPDRSIWAVFCADGLLIVKDGVTERESRFRIRSDLDQLARDYEATPFCQWVDFCRDRSHVVAIGDDHTVNLISIVSGEILRTFRKHTAAVIWIDCSPDGNVLATASVDHTLRLWDLSTGAELRELELHPKIEELTFSGDGRHLLVNVFLRKIETYEVEELLDRRIEKPVATHYFGDLAYGGIAVSPDGRRLATALWDNRIVICDHQYNELVRLSGHVDFACRFAFNSDGTRLVSTSADRTVRLWDTATGREILVLGKFNPFNCLVAFGNDDHQLILGDHSRRLRILDASPVAAPPRLEGTRVLQGHTSVVGSVNYSPDGQRLVSVSVDSGVYLWTVADGKHVRTIGTNEYTSNAQFSPDGHWITAVGVEDGRYAVKVWDANPPYRERFSRQWDRELAAVTFSADSRHVVVAGDGGILGVYDWQSDSKTGMGELGRHGLFVMHIAASPDGRYFASTGSDGSVKIWDATRLQEWQEGRVLYEGGPSLFWVGFSPDSRRLAVGGRDGDLEIVDVASGKTQVAIPGAHGDQVSHVCFDPSGKYIASCGADRTVRVWEAETGRPVDIFLEHRAPVVSVAFSPDGKHVASGGYDQTIRIWTPRLE